MVAEKEGQLTNDDGNNGSTNCCRTKQGLTWKKKHGVQYYPINHKPHDEHPCLEVYVT